MDQSAARLGLIVGIGGGRLPGQPRQHTGTRRRGTQFGRIETYADERLIGAWALTFIQSLIASHPQ